MKTIVSLLDFCKNKRDIFTGFLNWFLWQVLFLRYKLLKIKNQIIP